MHRIRERFERGWRFFKGEVRNGQAVSFPDATWRELDLPHDWSIEGPFDPNDPSGSGGGYLPGGIGWYRKAFPLPEAHCGKRLSIEFDGVYMNATVWLNGHELGAHAYGYTSFQFDLTPHLRFGKGKQDRNVLAVRVDNSKRPNTRWYSGSGIYRHVWLTVTDPMHVAHWGVAVSTIKASAAAATIGIETSVVNETDSSSAVALATRIVGPDGKTIASGEAGKTIRGGATGRFVQSLVVKQPSLWDVDSPVLYRAFTSIRVGGTVTDEVETSFGIRTFAFDPNEGFILNGRSVKLKGVNLHHDNGCLGAVVYDRAEERRVELMKSIGVNAIRTSHNPPSPEFIAACDRLGVVVMEEAFDEWEVGKLKHGYKDHFKACWRSDLSAMVLRDRNHPSIVLWSIGNEVPEQGKGRGARIAGQMAKQVRKLDPTRPVGYGAFPGAWTPQLWEAVDVCGYNYRDNLYASDHRAYPKRCIMGTETFSLFAFQSWTRTMDNRHIAGEFIWTGMDYIGEAGLGFSTEAESKYPTNTACCGELDLCGFKKTRSYYRDILWGRGAALHVAVRRRLADGEAFKLHPWGWPDAKSSWTWPSAQAKGDTGPADLQVDVYSACDEVELKLNGKTVGRNTTSRASRYMATWMVPFEPGTLEAIGYRGGKKVAVQTLRTAGAPAKIRLTPDRGRIDADGYDLSFVTVEVVDSSGLLHPNADNEIRFAVKGPGRVVGIHNGYQGDIGPFQALTHKVHHGRCLVVVKSDTKKGTIHVVAQSPGLASARVGIVSC